MNVTSYIQLNNVKSPYLKYAKNIYTQNGEDGIIEKILEELEITSGICVDIGSWDGIYLSNIYNLWRYKGFNAVLIEGDRNKALESLQLVQKFDNVEVMNCMVSSDPDSQLSLENLIEKSSFDFSDDNYVILNIDVDGDDYNIMKCVDKYRPIIIIVETCTDYNGTEKVVVSDGPFIWGVSGASLASLQELGETMGYKLICSTGNAFFVREDYVEKLKSYDKNLTSEDLYLDSHTVQTFLQTVDSEQNLNESVYYFQTSYYNNLIWDEKRKILEMQNEQV